ncbi:MAG: TolC family protein [Proteobacteria bacterium]|nr:TolC family protein [Pseudomonadota bacterium]
MVTGIAWQDRICSHWAGDYWETISFMLVAVLVIVPASVLADEQVVEENQAVEIAIADNPGLAELNARFEALSQIPSQVGTLPDPTVNFNAMNLPTDTFDRSQEAMTQLQLGFSQMIPFPGKLSLKREAAEYNARIAEHSVGEARLKLIKDVKIKWWQLYYLDQALDTVQNNQSLLRQFISVARTKYETGQGLQQDVLLAQLELSKLLDQEIQIEAIRRHQAISLNTLMDRPSNNPVQLPDDISILLPDLMGETEIYALAEVARPLLARSEMQISAAETQLKLAKRDYYPDFMVGINYGNRTGNNPLPRGGGRSDFASLMVGIKVPLYAGKKQSKAVSQRSYELEKTRYAFRDEAGLVKAAISASITDFDRAREQLSLYENGILTQARQTVESMLVGYQVSEVDFLNLVRSQITLFNYELQYWKVVSEAKQALASLEAAVGEDDIYE